MDFLTYSLHTEADSLQGKGGSQGEEQREERRGERRGGGEVVGVKHGGRYSVSSTAP